MLMQPVYKELSFVLTALRVPELCSSALIFIGPSTCMLPEFYRYLQILKMWFPVDLMDSIKSSGL